MKTTAPLRRRSSGQAEEGVGQKLAKSHRPEASKTGPRREAHVSPDGRRASAKRPAASEEEEIKLSTKPAAWKAPRPVQNAVVFVGSYHNVTAAYHVRKDTIAPKFTSSSHVGSINSVATCSRFFVSSGVDEAISIHGVRDNGAAFVDLGKVTPPCQINAMAFPDPRFVVCAADNGSLIVYKTREWTCAAVIEGAHERAAVDVAVHPAGALAVSVGLDNMVAVIDMVRASVVTRRKLDKILGAPVAVRFSESGDVFVVQTQYTACVFDTATATEIARAIFEKDPPNEIQALVVTSAFMPPSEDASRSVTIIAAVESGALYSAVLTTNQKALAADAANTTQSAPLKLLRPSWTPVTLNTPSELQLDPANPASSAVRRLRALQLVDGTLFAASSSGDVRVFDLSLKEQQQFEATLRCRYATGGRITALSVLKKGG